jgi:hypothetical protein
MRTWGKRILITLGVIAVVAGAYTANKWHSKQLVAAAEMSAKYQTQEEIQDKFVRFDMEAYDIILKNYWLKPEQFEQFGLKDFPTLFALSVQKATGASTTPTVETPDRAGIAKMLKKSFDAATTTDDGKRQLALNTLIVLTYNLLPAGRDQVLSTKQETQLRQEVSNVNPGKDLYGNLGVAKGASTAEVDAAYKKVDAALAASSSPQAKEERKQAAYAHYVLTNSTSKALYDQSQVEPSVFGHVLGSTLYIDFSQMTPTSLIEFARTVDQASTTPLSSMILDLRGNMGGALDFAVAFIGLFVGQNQYVYDLFHQGDYQPQRSTQAQFGELSRYGEVVVMADNMTQSTAEITTAALKRYHIATFIGIPTHGWGSVENTYPITTDIDPNSKYSLLLVNSLTLGDNQQPIEQNGVKPDVNTTDKDWKSQMTKKIESSSLRSAVEQMVAKGPWKY